MLTYEERLNNDPRWALSEGSKHFEERSSVQLALRRIAQRLEELGIPYAVAGGMALFAHGLRRFTEDVDILVTREGLNAIHKALDGLGYVRPFAKSKNLRNAELGVRIEFLVAGQFPGDGKPKPIAFPDPQAVATEVDGIRYLNVPTLIELKLASGMSSSHRAQDLVDVQRLIEVLRLPMSFKDNLHPSVQSKFGELYAAVHGTQKRYIHLWRNKWLTADAKSLDEMIESLRGAAETLEAMRAAGVVLDSEGGTSDDYAYLVTNDPDVAARFGMHEESEIWGDDEDEADERPGQSEGPDDPGSTSDANH